MMHPFTVVRIQDESMGYGVFATQFIPKGTIVFVQDPLDLDIPWEKFDRLPERYRSIVKKYGYVTNHGHFVVSWDHGKYVNHCCHPNTLTTGYGFEIAIEDIQAGEEITDDYGLLNLQDNFAMSCHKTGCRKLLDCNDWHHLSPSWDQTVKVALSLIKQVEQPLMSYLDEETSSNLSHYLETGDGYVSVMSQKYTPPHRAS